jgi:pilus assembly protein FimV
MRLRQLVLACGLSSFVLSPYASALGLGEVKLKSSLNQPLEAEVKLLDTRDLTAEQILVSLASPADFERNGVDRLYFYTELQFQVDLEAADGPKVIIRSRNPVREPYLNFLIEARWTAGRLLREYTLLMDLPTFEEDAKPAAVSAATTAAPVQRYQETPSAAPRATALSSNSTAARSTTVSKPSLSGDSYEVRANDTLWEIALRARPNSSVSVHQSMMALYRANPDAFINGNINKLRRGQVLRIPDASDMTSVAKSEAVSQFAQAMGDSSYGAQLNASRRANTARSEAAQVGGRVKLVAPSSGANNSGQGSGANDGSGRALEGELAATLEELDKTRSENTELSSRVKDLEAQIETMERLVAVSNEKLRALQLAAGQQEDASAQTDAPAQVDAPADAASAEPAAALEAETAAPAPTSSPAAVQPPQPTPPKPAPAVSRPAPEQGIMASLKENPLWLALAALGVFGAGAAAYVYRRRKEAEEEQLEDEEVFALDDSVAEEDEQVQQEEDESLVSNEESLFEEDAETSAVAETGDVVGEADIYIAYGKLDQAEEMLLNALEKDPQSTDIRMKLLEVYAQQQNASGFDKHYALLLPVASAALLSRASELRESIPGAGSFAGAAENASAEEFGEFSLDDLDSNSLLEPEAAVAQEDLGGEEFNFDFDLNLDDDAQTIATLESAEADKQDALDGESAFDFDLTAGEEELSADSSVNGSADSSDLSLSLDDLDDLDVASLDSASVATEGATDEDDFNFDFEDDLQLADLAPTEEAASESLDVAADDFNLDMNVDDVDLAALDHEMESLDVSFDDELADTGAVATETVNEEPAFLSEDIDSSALALTDDLNKEDQIELDAELLDADDEVAGGSLQNSADLADIEFDLSDESVDFEALNEELDALDALADVPEVTEEASETLDLELADENLLSDVDELASLADSINEADAEEASALAEQTALSEPAEQDQEEDLFAEALSDFGSDADELDLDAYTSDESALADLSDEEMDSELDFLADADEAATKLDLARAYIDMGDAEGAKDILSEVVNEGNEEQRKEAAELLGRIV